MTADRQHDERCLLRNSGPCTCGEGERFEVWLKALNGAVSAVVDNGDYVGHQIAWRKRMELLEDSAGAIADVIKSARELGDATSFIAECARHPNHLLDAEQKSRALIAALARLDALATGNSVAVPDSDSEVGGQA